MNEVLLGLARSRISQTLRSVVLTVALFELEHGRPISVEAVAEIVNVSAKTLRTRDGYLRGENGLLEAGWLSIDDEGRLSIGPYFREAGR